MIIYFEGVDGAGKTTVMRELSLLLTQQGTEHVVTKEPGGPVALEAEWGPDYPYGEKYEGFRQLCVDRPDLPQLVKRALYRADSIMNWLKVVEPNGHGVVLCDRSWVSDLAYGTVLTGANMDDLYRFNRALTPAQVSTGYVVYVGCDPEVREARLADNITNHMDTLGAKTRTKIESAYKVVLDLYVAPQRRIMLDSTKLTAKQLAADIMYRLFRKESRSQ